MTLPESNYPIRARPKQSNRAEAQKNGLKLNFVNDRYS